MQIVSVFCRPIPWGRNDEPDWASGTEIDIFSGSKKKALEAATGRRGSVKSGDKLVIVGCSGSGGPAAMLAKKLMPEVDITVIRKEEFFIVR
jgi:hypothetical protein